MTTNEKLTVIQNTLKECASFADDYGYGDYDSMIEAVALIQEVKNEYQEILKCMNLTVKLLGDD
jgi:hypothetical protein